MRILKKKIIKNRRVELLATQHTTEYSSVLQSWEMQRGWNQEKTAGAVQGAVMSLARWFRVGSRECAHPFLKGGGRRKDVSSLS